jgi:hypothetical protein
MDSATRKSHSHSGHSVDASFAAIAGGIGITRQAVDGMSRKAINKMRMRLYILSEIDRAESLGGPVDDEAISDSLSEIIKHQGYIGLNNILLDRFFLSEDFDQYHDDTECVLRGLLVGIII